MVSWTYHGRRKARNAAVGAFGVQPLGQERGRLLKHVRIDRPRQLGTPVVCTVAARARIWVVESLHEQFHQAPAIVRIGAHLFELAVTGGGDPLDALDIWRPSVWRPEIAAALASDRPVELKHLQGLLHLAAPQGFDQCRRPFDAGFGEIEGPVDQVKERFATEINQTGRIGPNDTGPRSVP